MVVGWFSFRGRPSVKTRVIVPRLGVQRAVDFLVDTGADSTCVNHRDVANMELFPELFRESERTYSIGVGGFSRYFVEDARIEFLDTDEDYPREYPVSLRIADFPMRRCPFRPCLGGTF